jgi:hypothetical protein
MRGITGERSELLPILRCALEGRGAETLSLRLENALIESNFHEQRAPFMRVLSHALTMIAATVHDFWAWISGNISRVAQVLELFYCLPCRFLPTLRQATPTAS